MYSSAWIAADVAHAVAWSALLFEQAISARRDVRSILYALTAIADPMQFFTRRAQVEIPLRIVDELAFSEESLAVTATFVRRDICLDPHTLDRAHVLCGAVLGIAGHVTRLQAPAEDGPPQ